MTTRSKDWLIVIGLIGLALIPIVGGIVRTGKILDGNSALENARFLSGPISTVTHIFAASIYSLLGAIQFAPEFRLLWPRWHRTSGAVLIVLAILVALTGLSMTVNFAPVNHDGPVVFFSRLVVGMLMLMFTVFGVLALLRRKFSEHGDWMIRSYALAMGAGTQVLTHIPLFIAPYLHTETGRAFALVGGWAINFAVAEWIIGQSKRPSHSVCQISRMQKIVSKDIYEKS
jgi:hypothetical protein